MASLFGAGSRRMLSRPRSASRISSGSVRRRRDVVGIRSHVHEPPARQGPEAACGSGRQLVVTLGAVLLAVCVVGYVVTPVAGERARARVRRGAGELDLTVLVDAGDAAIPAPWHSRGGDECSTRAEFAVPAPRARVDERWHCRRRRRADSGPAKRWGAADPRDGDGSRARRIAQFVVQLPSLGDLGFPPAAERPRNHPVYGASRQLWRRRRRSGRDTDQPVRQHGIASLLQQGTCRGSGTRSDSCSFDRRVRRRAREPSA